MGQALVRAIVASSDATVSGGTEVAGSKWIGRDVAEPCGIDPIGALIGDDPEALFKSSDVVLDFTAPAALLQHAKIAAATGTALVVGTTGANVEEDRSVLAAAKRTAIVRSANMSVGVNLLVALAKKAASALDLSWDAEVLEMHHRHKIDAPSGTAKALGNAIAEGRGQTHDRVAVTDRNGERKRGQIGYATLRGGMVVGDHTVIFASDRERIELSHKASSRDVFAEGAVAAARWVKGKPPGLYSMADVLGLKD